MVVSWLFGGKFGNLLHADMRLIFRAERADVFRGNSALNDPVLIRSGAVELARNVNPSFTLNRDGIGCVTAAVGIVVILDGVFHIS